MSLFTHLCKNRSVAQIPHCISPISYNAPLCDRNVQMVHCGIFIWCTVGFVRWDYCWRLLQHRISMQNLITLKSRKLSFTFIQNNQFICHIVLKIYAEHDSDIATAPWVVYTVKPLVLVAPNSKTYMFLVSSCSCLRSIHWSQVLSWEWRCSWSSADRRCSNYIWVINNFIAH